MAWRLAESIDQYRDQINIVAPSRSKASDGTVGDEAHQQTSSDHNPRVFAGLGSTPVVTACDITHDPRGGLDFALVAERLRRSRDRRIKYVIFNRRMFSWYPSGGYPPWTWRPYSGDNPHDHHGHLSVRPEFADDRSVWAVGEGETVDEILNLVRTIQATLQWEIRNWMKDIYAWVKEIHDRPQAPVTDEQIYSALRRILKEGTDG